MMPLYVREINLKTGVFMRTILEVLDQAKRALNITSDYRLAIMLGIGESALSNYRQGRSLPDEKAAAKLAAAMGEKPDLLLVEIQAQRVKDLESKAMWMNLAKRLQAGFADVQNLILLAIVAIAVAALPALFAVWGVASIPRMLCILC